MALLHNMPNQTSNEGMKIKLHLKQERFCQLFASDKEFFGNGAQSYLEAYEDKKSKKIMSYKAARACASRLLTNANILSRINELLDIFITNEIVDKNLGLVILQNADFHAKVAAIKEYNQLKNRITQKIEAKIGIININQLLDDIHEGKFPEIE